MAAMNKTQREHLICKLRKMRNAAIEKRYPVEDNRDLELHRDMPIARMVQGLKDGTIIINPEYVKKHVGETYGGITRVFVPAGAIELKEKRERRMKEQKKFQEALDNEISNIEDRLIFEDVSGVEAIISGFELTINQLLNSRK